MSYWCYRIDKKRIKFFTEEMFNGNLRQGWGWDARQNLKNITMDEGAKRNLPMLKVKRGDIILVPQLPTWNEVSIVEATEDWKTGYKFEMPQNIHDYGHIFPIKFIKSFIRNNENVSGKLRSTLKNPSRFWNINHYAEYVEQLIHTEETDLHKGQTIKGRVENAIEKIFLNIFDENEFSEQLYKEFTNQFTREEWEFALEYGLSKVFPSYKIERVGGIKEKEHGTDIIIKIPSIIPDYEYAIAIQVKDYEGFVGKQVIQQIEKSNAYWDNENIKLIEKIVIITRSTKELNENLLNINTDVKFIFASDLRQIILEIGKKYIGINN